MRLLTRMRLWLRALFARDSVESEMSREMRFHIESEAERLTKAGVSPDEARRRAMAQFGGVERYKEEVRAERGTAWLDALGTEVRIAARTLTARPAFTAVVVLTIAVGIGATTAVFSWAEWTLYRPVPGVQDPTRVVSIGFQQNLPDGGIAPTGMSYPNFTDLAATTKSFEGMAGYAQVEAQLAAPGVEPSALQGDVVLGDYFGVLGAVPRLGRLFSHDEMAAHATDRVMIISDSLWQASYGGTRTVLGKRVNVNGTEFTIIGVAPPRFRGTSRAGAIDVWFPPSAYPVVQHQPMDLANRRASAFQQLIGRLRPGVTPQLAQAELDRRLAILIAAYPGINGVYATCKAYVNADIGMVTFRRVSVAATTRMLLGIVALVLLIACANVANLLLLRGVRRREEVAVRRALGASALRVIGQHLVEGLMLSVVGGAAGIGLAAVLARVFTSPSASGRSSFDHFALDGRVLAVAALLAVGTGLLFGLAPAVAALRHDPMRELKEGLRSHSGRRAPVRSTLTVVQIGAAMALVVGALLLGRTLYGIAHIDLGFDVNHVSVFWVNARPQGYAPDRVEALRRQVVERTATLPGVTDVALASTLPGMGAFITGNVRVEGDTTKNGGIQPTTFTVTPDFFRALRIPIIRGRGFTSAEFDDTTSRSVVVSLTAAKMLFGATDPLGRQIQVQGLGAPSVNTIVGVTGDIHIEGPQNATGAAVYSPAVSGFAARLFNPSFALIIRSSKPDDELRAGVRSVLATIAPDLPLPTAQSYASIVRNTVSDRYLFARLVGVLAVLAIALAAVGLYSVIAFAVAERTREIGIRMALGAQTSSVVGLVGRQSARLVAVGLVLGIGGAVALARGLASRLFGVTPLDPWTYVVAVLVWLVLAAVATVVPARAATRVDPTIAMRAE